MKNRALFIGLVASLGVGTAHAAAAATRCVTPGGGSGCFSSINAAVAAAAAGDTIQVAHGTYAEDVVIDKALSLIGDRENNTIIDASGRLNGVNVDGLHHPGLAHVVITGFTVENAILEGIIVSNASDVTVRDNRVVRNNLGLDTSAGTCPEVAPPDSHAGEDFDCGEGIHLSGVDHSTVATNVIEHNSGGILLTDDSGPTHDNLISGNIVRDNVFDCGITLASHVPLMFAPNGNGVFHNTIANNESSGNGTAIEGAGAGVGIFTPAPGTATYANVVIGNRLVNNGLPGVALHSHAPGQNLNDNQIIGNFIAGNGADTEDTATPGPTGINIASGRDPAGNVVGSAITGTVVSHNVIEREAVAVAVSDPAGADVDLHLNDLVNDHHIGVANLGAGTVNAIENYWGCPSGPGAGGCSTVSGAGIVFTPSLRHRVHEHP
jgi:parallel beta-helix repeat protein